MLCRAPYAALLGPRPNGCLGGRPVVLLALPLGALGWGSSLPLLELAVFVGQAEPASREPPAHRTSEGCPLAPAVRITAALAVTRVVDTG